MQRVKQHKWFLFILIGFIVISFFQFLPQTDTLHLYEKTPQSFELTAGGLLKYGIEGQNADQAGECELEEYHRPVDGTGNSRTSGMRSPGRNTGGYTGANDTE